MAVNGAARSLNDRAVLGDFSFMAFSTAVSVVKRTIAKFMPIAVTLTKDFFEELTVHLNSEKECKSKKKFAS